MGDGGATSASWTTTIDNVLTGNGLNKTGTGTLVLNGANTYTQDTRLSAGTLSVSSGREPGRRLQRPGLQGGTLRASPHRHARHAPHDHLGAAGGGFDIADAQHLLRVANAVRQRRLTKLGAGTLALLSNNDYTGVTRVASGTLQLGDGGSYGSIAGDAIVQAGATLAFNRPAR